MWDVLPILLPIRVGSKTEDDDGGIYALRWPRLPLFL
jgi:hypothetical protein